MDIFQPSENPGIHERLLLLKVNNPLFTASKIALNDETMELAQRQDHDALIAFLKHQRQLFEKVANLQSNEDSELILALKSELDELYHQSCLLPDDQSETKASIDKLIEVMMQSITQAAGVDKQAHEELHDERLAREAHFQLLQSSLVAAVLSADDYIAADELVPLLLSIPDNELSLALQLFDAAQAQFIDHQARQLLSALTPEQCTLYDKNSSIIQAYSHT